MTIQTVADSAQSDISISEQSVEQLDPQPTDNSVPSIERKQNGQVEHLDTDDLATIPYPADRAHLPTLPLEYGYRQYTDPETGELRYAPLTLLDIHYPTEDDIGVVFVSQGSFYAMWAAILATLLRTYFGPRWLILQDNLIYWQQPGVPPTGPDIAIIPDAVMPDEDHESYHVGRDGPIPIFVAEITSKSTRKSDLNTKPTRYAALGIQEYLIIDIRTRQTKDWRLIGYRLDGNHPEYRKLQPDADGGITFPNVSLRFEAVNRSRIEVYSVATGERLLTLDEQKERAESAEQQAVAAEQRAEFAEQRAAEEVAARQRVEQENAALAAELARLRAQLGQ